MTDNVNHPKHYTGPLVSIECIQITRHMGFLLGNAFKYIWRAGHKGDVKKAVEDLDKALWYIQMYRRDYAPVDHDNAKLIFNLLPVPDSWEASRYAALKGILYIDFDAAHAAVNKMKKYFQGLLPEGSL